MRRTQPSYLAAACSWFVTTLLACGGPSTPSPPDAPGNSPPPAVDSITFGYSIGSSAASFAAKGGFRFKPNGAPALATMAAAWIYPYNPDFYRVIGQQVKASELRAVTLNFYEVGEGESVQLLPPEPAEECRHKYCMGMSFLLGSVPANTTGDFIQYEHLCHILSGSVRVTDARNERLRGVFSGTGTCWNYLSDTEEPFSVSGGAFDLPFTDELLSFNALTTPYGLLPPGSVTFDYSTLRETPPRVGQFRGQGAAWWDRYEDLPPTTGTWAYGQEGSNDSTYQITARQALGQGEQHSASIFLRKPLPSDEIRFGCALGDTGNCGGLSMELQANPSSGQGNTSCLTSHGTLRLTRLTWARMSGTFSGSSDAWAQPGCEFRNGTFDVPRLRAFDRPF